MQYSAGTDNQASGVFILQTGTYRTYQYIAYLKLVYKKGRQNLKTKSVDKKGRQTLNKYPLIHAAMLGRHGTTRARFSISTIWK
jgi:hypothetical protein